MRKRRSGQYREYVKCGANYRVEVRVDGIKARNIATQLEAVLKRDNDVYTMLYNQSSSLRLRAEYTSYRAAYRAVINWCTFIERELRKHDGRMVTVRSALTGKPSWFLRGILSNNGYENYRVMNENASVQFALSDRPVIYYNDVSIDIVL